MKTNKNLTPILFLFLSLILLFGCDREETLEVRPIFETEEESTAELDIYLKTNFRDPFGANIIYKFLDQYIDQNFKVTPPKLEVVKPTLELIKKLWIVPYNKASDQGETFLKTNFPAEIVLLGEPIINADNSQTLGIAEGGARVTLTNINNYDPNDKDWILKTLRFAHHEFVHILDQNRPFNVQSFYDISGEDYTSPGTWTSLSQDDAISRGMVTNYGTSAVAEDFAELISTIIVTDPADFEAQFLTLEDCSSSSDAQSCLALNKGKERIRQKYDIVVKYLKEDVGIDLFILRDEFLKNIN